VEEEGRVLEEVTRELFARVTRRAAIRIQCMMRGKLARERAAAARMARKLFVQKQKVRMPDFLLHQDGPLCHICVIGGSDHATFLRS
jgi:hypothetical protein